MESQNYARKMEQANAVTEVAFPAGNYNLSINGTQVGTLTLSIPPGSDLTQIAFTQKGGTQQGPNDVTWDASTGILGTFSFTVNGVQNNFSTSNWSSGPGSGTDNLGNGVSQPWAASDDDKR